MMPLASALYRGHVMHQRLRPRPHRLAYRVFWLLLDLDELDTVSVRCRLFSHNRANLISVRDRDYGDGSGRPLAGQVRDLLAGAGVPVPTGPVRLLTMPRILGYAFNPLNIYFCHDGPDERLAAIVYEVNNTFGERHSYVAPVEGDASRPVVQACAKRFHVSPFLGLDMTYVFRVRPPGTRVVVAISGRDRDGPIIGATLAGDRADLNDAALARALAAFPLLTLKVSAAILWEALRLWLKGVRVHRHRPAQGSPVTRAQAGHATDGGRA